MIIEKIGQVEIQRHDDIGELIVKNYNIFNTLALIDSESGHDMEAVNRLFYKMDAQLASGRKDDCIQTRKNLQHVFYNIFQKNNFPSLQWAALVYTIDGQENKDLSADNLKRIIDRLSDQGLTQNKILKDVEDAKKKFVTNYNFASRKSSATVQ